MQDHRVTKLTEGQRECLRRVLLHMTSKDIARELGISPHTVDQRLRVALRTLGVGSRIEAARLLAAHEGSEPILYQPPAYQSPVVAPEPDVGCLDPATAGERYVFEHEHGQDARERQLTYQAFVPDTRQALPLPFPTSADAENQLSSWQRIGWIAAIAVSSALAFGAVLAGLEALASLG